MSQSKMKETNYWKTPRYNFFIMPPHAPLPIGPINSKRGSSAAADEAAMKKSAGSSPAVPMH
jgi:hypothetical protein